METVKGKLFWWDTWDEKSYNLRQWVLAKNGKYSRNVVSLWWSKAEESWQWMYCGNGDQKKALPGLSLEEAQQVVEVAVRLSGRL